LTSKLNWWHENQRGIPVDVVPYLAFVSALAALGLAAFFYTDVKKASPGNERMVYLMTEIQSGARAFLKQEYTWVAVFVVVLTILLTALNGVYSAAAYVLGAVLSGLAGYIGMTVATMANARTTEAAKEGPAKALPVAFRGGAVMGFSVAGLALGGLMLVYILFVMVLQVDDAFNVVTAFGLGASSIALFSRVGGGIFTKAADVGADLVGKVEAGIPEDDPRNPATIADNVGDNVGDVAGMGADLFESYAGSIIAPVALTAFTFALVADGDIGEGQLSLLFFPMLIAFIGMIASIIGSFLVKGGDSTDSHALSRALHMGTNVAMVITVIGTIAGAFWMFGDSDLFAQPLGLAVSVIGGLIVGWALGKTAEYYTSDHFNPVKQIANQAETGPATVIIKGISAGMISVAASVALLGIGIGIAYLGGQWAVGDVTGLGDVSRGDLQSFGGLYGIAVAAIGMLATTGVVVSVDAYGPIADNAGGIAEMAELDPSVREVTDALDSLGNTTAAVAKGFAVGSAALTALALFKSFEFAVVAAAKAEGKQDIIDNFALDVGSVPVFLGLFAGAMLPFLFAALTMDAVGRAAFKMIEEVRRQFREIPGLREGEPGVNPDSAKCVAISTQASLREMVIPGALAVIVPLIIGFLPGGINALGGFLAGALVSGFALAIFMANAGGAWDNAKKYIEAGNHGGKGSDPHKAAVVGDTVGDPFKDTSGPAMNILIKVMTIVSLVFASAFVAGPWA
jgi:K(+)-stimulated pyrophosphate-energized sodium pump